MIEDLLSQCKYMSNVLTLNQFTVYYPGKKILIFQIWKPSNDIKKGIFKQSYQSLFHKQVKRS